MRIFKAAIWLAAAAAVTALLNTVFIPYQFPRMKIHRLETETFSDLILGSSHAASVLDPAVIEQQTGRSCFNAAAGGQYPLDNYYLLKDACRHHKPERVIWEYDPAYWAAQDERNANARYLLSCMQWSGVRLQYLKELCWENDFRYLVMPWFLYRDSFKEIPRNLRVRRSSDYRSYGIASFESDDQSVRENGLVAIHDDALGEQQIPELQVEDEKIWAANRSDFIRAADYCLQNGIELVVAATPVPEETREANRAFYERADQEMSSLSEQYGFLWINEINTAMPEESFSDTEGHMRESAAAAFSRTFARKLT